MNLSDRDKALNATLRGMLWAIGAGMSFALLNTIMRNMALQMEPVQAAFLRYGFGFLVLLPVALRHGLGKYRTKAPGLQWIRGVVHSAGIIIWITALPHLPLPFTTALGFTGPIFIMLGASLFLGEQMHKVRWGAALLGFVGVLIIVSPRFQTGADLGYSLLMISSAPIFAASFLIAKVLTRHDRPATIVFWQALTVSLLIAPLAYWVWEPPTTTQWLWFVVTGCLGSFGHWCLTRAYAIADISAAQPVKFLDLVWASVLGFLVFQDIPSVMTFVGGAVIVAATFWVARYERRSR